MSSSFLYFFFFKQKTAYEMRISYWSSDVCSSDLVDLCGLKSRLFDVLNHVLELLRSRSKLFGFFLKRLALIQQALDPPLGPRAIAREFFLGHIAEFFLGLALGGLGFGVLGILFLRSEEHTSELQSLMRISYAVFCLK